MSIDQASTPTNLVETTTMGDDLARLRSQLERTQSAFVSTLMEKNFLQRAMADLNFHHNAHDGIVFTDAQNRVVYANPYFLKMMNISDPAELLGKPLPGYMWDNEDDPKRLFEDVRKDGFVRERELALHDARNQAVFAACSSVASKDEDGQFIGTEIMLCNITTKRKIQVELMERTQALERANEFCHHCLEQLTDMTQRKISHDELLKVLRSMEKELATAAFQ
jgi:PAS domain-containing protein